MGSQPGQRSDGVSSLSYIKIDTGSGHVHRYPRSSGRVANNADREVPMKLKSLLSIAALAFIAQSAAFAVPIHYEGSITTNAPNGPTIPVTGNVGGFSFFDDDTTGVDFWSFTALAGQNIFVRVTRLNAALDPIALLYSGTTTADVSIWPQLTALSIGQSFGGLT